jgi:hypothetical protein
LPCGKGGFHLLPNAKRIQVRFAHGSLLRPENNCSANLLCGRAIAVMHNTKLRFSIRCRCWEVSGVCFASESCPGSQRLARPLRADAVEKRVIADAALVA